MTGARNPELEGQILEAPEDPEAYLVYADWLQAAEDPRGKLIAAQAARSMNPESAELAAAEAALLEAHREELLGPALGVEHGPTIEWHLGFWRSLSLGSFAYSAAPAGDDHVATVLALASARFLREVRIQGTLTGRILSLLAPLRGTLELIDVSLQPHGQFHDDDLLAVGECPRLHRLNLYSCESLTERGLAALRSMPRLAEIDLRNCPLDDAGALCLEDLPLTSVKFNVVTPGFSELGMRALANGPLVSLELRAEGMAGCCIAPLAAHPTLANLELPDAAIGVSEANVLGTLPALRRLYIPSSSLDDASARAFAQRAESFGLRSLSVGHCRSIGNDACSAIARLVGLTFLDLSATAVGLRGLRYLRDLPALEHLDVSFLELNNGDLVELAGHTKLRSLSLAYSRALTDHALDVLVQFQALERLDLASTAITTHAIDRLATLPHLTELGLEDCAGEVVEYARTFHQWHVNSHDLLELYDGIGTYDA